METMKTTARISTQTPPSVERVRRLIQRLEGSTQRRDDSINPRRLGAQSRANAASDPASAEPQR